MKSMSEWIVLLRGGLESYGLALLAQLLTAGAGLVFVNLLTKDDFALFAVFTALLQAFTAQSDLGTLGAVGYFYREHSSWNNFKTIALPAIARIRVQFFLLAGIVLIILFVNSHTAQSATAIRTAELLCLTVGIASLAMVSALQTVVLRVRGYVNAALRIDAAAAFVRFALAVGMVGFRLMSAEAALITTLLSTIVSFLMGRSYVPEIPLGLPRQKNKDEQHKVFKYVLPLIPGSIYYSLQPSILIWLSAIFGNSQRVAEVGAISRIGQIIAFFGFGLNFFIFPHLAALRDERAFGRSYVQIWLILGTLGPLLFLTVALARSEILLLLGPKYSNLGNEVNLVSGTSLLSIAAYYGTIVNRLRGWNKLEPLITILQFTTQVLLIAWLPLNSTAGILILGLLFAVVTAFITFGVNIIGFLRPDWVVISYRSASGPNLTPDARV